LILSLILFPFGFARSTKGLAQPRSVLLEIIRESTVLFVGMKKNKMQE